MPSDSCSLSISSTRPVKFGLISRKLQSVVGVESNSKRQKWKSGFILVVLSSLIVFMLSIRGFRNRASLVSIIVTCRNNADSIQQVLTSVMSQSYRSLQIIVVDDASTDGTRSEILKATLKDTRIQYVQLHVKTLGGVGFSANAGLDLARGKYVTFVDGSDFIDKHLISRAISAAEKSKSELPDVVLLKMNYIHTGDHSPREYWPDERYIRDSQLHPFSLEENENISLSFAPYTWKNLYKRQYIENNGIRFSEGDYFLEDKLFQMDIMLHNPRFSFVSQRNVHFRVGKRPHIPVFNCTAELQRYLNEQSSTEELVTADTQYTKAVSFVPVMNRIGFSISSKLTQVSGEQKVLSSALYYKSLSRAKRIFSEFKIFPHTPLLKKVSSVFYRGIERWETLFNLELEASDSQKNVMGPEKQLTIVVVAKNNKDHILTLARSLKELECSNEVIFLDTNSTDGTASVLQELTKSRADWYVMHSPRHEVGRVRNLGRLFSESKYIIWIDSNAYIYSNALDEAVHRAHSEKLDVLLVRYDTEDDQRGIVGNSKWDGAMNAKRQIVGDFFNKTENIDALKYGVLVKREFVEREDIFYGSTRRYFDVLFMWHILWKARTISIFDHTILWSEKRAWAYESELDMLSVPVCVKRTQRLLTSSGIAKNPPFEDAWRDFARTWIKSTWRKIRNKDRRKTFEERVRSLSVGTGSLREALVIDNAFGGPLFS